jgi:hypothetical protein
MKKILFLSGILAMTLSASFAQRHCGYEKMLERAMQNDPSFAQQIKERREERRLQIQEAVARGEHTFAKSSATPTIPVVIHFVLKQSQIDQIGGTAGLQQRVVSQLAALNEDFNRQNADSTLIPAAFKPLFGNLNIRFGLARRTPGGQSTPGYEVKVITGDGFGSQWDGYADAKHLSSGGANAWDATKYLNIWVINPTDNQTILGICIPPGNGPQDELGVVINYRNFGRRTSSSDYYSPSTIDKGRTLTHEVGHYFELWHIWGDDGGGCPGTGGTDDDISDTPPQSTQTYSFPQPVYPKTDNCSPGAPGIMFMNFMDYVDDADMQMFTKQQAIAANLSLNNNSISLTQHPELLEWPTDVSIVEQEHPFSIAPNPSNGKFSLNFTGTTNSLQSITVINVTGQKVQEVKGGANTAIYNFDISGISKGVYFVQCRFDEGIVTRKIVLE